MEFGGCSLGGWGGCALHFEADFPKDSGEFAGDGDFDFVMMHEAGLEFFETGAEAVLRFPGDFFDPFRLAFLALGEGAGDFGRDAVVGGAFDEHPTEMGISALGDGALFLLSSRGVFAGC